MHDVGTEHAPASCTVGTCRAVPCSTVHDGSTHRDCTIVCIRWVQHTVDPTGLQVDARRQLSPYWHLHSRSVV